MATTTTAPTTATVNGTTVQTSPLPPVSRLRSMGLLQRQAYCTVFGVAAPATLERKDLEQWALAVTAAAQTAPKYTPGEAVGTSHSSPAPTAVPPAPVALPAVAGPIVPPAPSSGPVLRPVQGRTGTAQVFVHHAGTAGLTYRPATVLEAAAASVAGCQTRAELDGLLDVVCELAAKHVVTLDPVTPVVAPVVVKPAAVPAPAPVAAPVAKPAVKPATPSTTMVLVQAALAAGTLGGLAAACRLAGVTADTACGKAMRRGLTEWVALQTAPVSTAAAAPAPTAVQPPVAVNAAAAQLPVLPAPLPTDEVLRGMNHKQVMKLGAATVNALASRLSVPVSEYLATTAKAVREKASANVSAKLVPAPTGTDLMVPGCFDAQGKPMTLSQVMRCVRQVAVVGTEAVAA